MKKIFLAAAALTLAACTPDSYQSQPQIQLKQVPLTFDWQVSGPDGNATVETIGSSGKPYTTNARHFVLNLTQGTQITFRIVSTGATVNPTTYFIIKSGNNILFQDSCDCHKDYMTVTGVTVE